MLVDKYKPLRTGHIESADDKIKNMTPKVMASNSETNVPAPVPTDVDGEHKPWLVAFKVPSHATGTPAIKYGRLPPSLRASISTVDAVPVPKNPCAKAEAKKLKKRTAGADRLTKARELALDYRLGGSLEVVETARTVRKNLELENDEDSDSGQTTRRMQPNPVTMRAWASLIEDKIEVCLSIGPIVLFLRLS